MNHNSNQSNILLKNKYLISSFIGGGSFGKIYKAIDVETKENLAVKIEKILKGKVNY